MNRPRFFPVHSLRLRIALLSVLVSGAVLAVFIVMTFAAVQRMARMRMEDNIKEFAHKHLVDSPTPRHWERVSDSLRFFLGDYEDDSFILMVQDREGRVLFVSPNWPEEIPLDDFPPAAQWGRYAQEDRPPPARNPAERFEPPHPPPLKVPEFFTCQASGAKWRIGKMGNPDLTIVLGMNMRRQTREMMPIRRSLMLSLPVALLLIAAGAWLIAAHALKPVETLSATIERVKAKGLDQRVSSQGTDREFARLIAVFNDMMEWLETTFRQAIRFSADASHELKTPLTVLQTKLEQAVHECPPGSPEQRRYVAFGRELQRLKSITQKLLLLSRIDAGELKLALRPLDLSEMLEGIIEDTEVLAPSLHIERELHPALHVMADAELMKQVIQNIAANAIKFNYKEGTIRFDLQAADGGVLLTVANTGPGIAPEDREKIFTRFFRGDTSRSRHVTGAGLGLSLAREIIRAHQGDLTLETATGKETVFTLRLPRAMCGGGDHESDGIVPAGLP